MRLQGKQGNPQLQREIPILFSQQLIKLVDRKKAKDVEDLNHTIDHLDLIDIYTWKKQQQNTHSPKYSIFWVRKQVSKM